MMGSRFGDSAVSLRVRCGRMIRETATWVGVLLVSTAGLLGFVTGESIQVHATSVLVFGIIPAAAVLILAAILVSLLRFVGSVYDLLRAALLYGLGSCVCLGAAFYNRIAHFHELNSYRVFVRATDHLVQATKAGAIWTRHLLKRGGETTRKGWALVVREIILEVLWAQQAAARLVAIMPYVAGWPIRTSARLLLSFINMSGETAIVPTRRDDCSPDRAAIRLEAFGNNFVGEVERRAA
jgi:hypothetical protein